MAYQIDPAAFAAHAFEYDDLALDKPLVDFIQTFYTLSDNKEHPNQWASCFTEDAIMKRASTDAVGREEIAGVNEGSWKGQASRQHVVYKIFPFRPGKPEEVMLYGLSKYIYEDSSTGQMPWSARIEFERSESAGILIKLYHIYSGQLKKN